MVSVAINHTIPDVENGMSRSGNKMNIPFWSTGNNEIKEEKCFPD
jgi:hypothetical protein